MTTSDLLERLESTLIGLGLVDASAREGQFTGAIQRSAQPAPSRFSIQALEPTQTLSLDLAGLNRLYDQSLDWATLGRLQMGLKISPLASFRAWP